LVGKVVDKPRGWESERSFATAYWFGRKRYDCLLSHKRPSGLVWLQ
jgi:hypothetical protein